MSATKFTPGPWKVTGDYDTQVEAGHDYRGTVAQAVGSGLMDLAEAKANARLIAAAPELLRTLQHLVGVCEEGARHMDHELAEARAIIAKARGER